MQPASTGELLRFFFQLGLTAFGGPVAHMAIMDREAVQRRKWMSRQEFVDMMGLLNLIPGPNSTQMVMYVGYKHGRVRGMLASGLGFIIPAATLTLILTWLYIAYGSLPQGQAILHGIQPVVVAVIASALWQIVPKGVIDWPTGLIFAAALGALFLGISEVIVVLAGGLLGWLWFSRIRPRGTYAVAFPLLIQLGLSFAKIALTLYGTGYLLVAYMQGEFVDRLGWLTNQQLLDVIAIGQMTPGPFLTTATSAGMLIGGLPGALVATVAIFTPSFFLIALIGPRIERMRNSAWGRHLLKGLNAAVVAVLLAVALKFGYEVATHWSRLLVAVIALLLLERFKANAMLLVAMGALYGLLF